MKGLRWLGLVWHSVLCFPRMAKLQSDAPVSVNLVYFPKSSIISVSQGSEVFTTQPWCTSMASLSQTTPEVTSHSRQMSQTFSDTQKSIIFKRSYWYKMINTFRNLLTVAVNNTLTRFTVPQGYTKWGVEAQGYPAGYSTLEYNFDFFNYAGIHRCLWDFKSQRAIMTIW